MNTSSIWSDLVPEKDGVKSSINDIAISPDGSRVVVAVGNRILLYNGENGDLIDSLRGHKMTVHSVDFSHDGAFFASGGRDNVVVIWKSIGTAYQKYTHTTPIQRVKYSPTVVKLASCAESDFGLLSAEPGKVLKEKISSRITSVAWSLDGSTLALGTVSGVVSIRNHNAEEIARIERKAPVWCLLYVSGSSLMNKSNSQSNQSDNSDVLVTGCWQKTLAFYKVQDGTYKIYNEKAIGFYPCGISLLGPASNKSSYLVVSGSNKRATMYSKEGVRLADLSKKDSWIWGCCCSPIGDKLVIGTDNGAIEAVQVDFRSVHALYKDRYAYRENLTEIIVHHLVQDRKVRIKCKDLIRHIALYKNKLAVHLTDRVCIYESSSEDSADMHFRVRRERMTLRPTADFAGCDHLAITSTHVIFCTKNVIELYSFDGVRQRVWNMDTPVKYMQVDGGPEGKEGILVGLESGILVKIFCHNPFPVQLTKNKNSIISADLSLDRLSIATVDVKGVLNVINLKTQNVVFSMEGVTSCCFNTEVSTVLSYSTSKSIFAVSGLGATIVKDDGSTVLAPIEPQEQYISGQVIGFQGQRIYCLYRGSISSIDVPQGKYMTKALDSGDPKAAYSIACLGVTESDWKMLAIRSLRMNSIAVSKNAFSRLKETKFLSLIEQIERSSVGTENKVARNAKGLIKPTSSQISSLDAMWNAELLAYEGHHSEAAKAYVRINKIDEAVRLFTDMRLWEEAIILSRNSGKVDVSDLVLKQAQWLQETGDWKGSSELYMSLGNNLQAVKIISQMGTESNQWQQAMIDIVRATSADNTETLQFCGEFFSSVNEDLFAKETFLKLGDISKLMKLYVSKQSWKEAAKLADEHEGKFDASVFLPYAEWLISNDRFEDAMNAFKKAARKDLSQKLLQDLTNNAVVECRFKDAGYFYWKLSKESENEDDEAKYQLTADLYYAYTTIHSYVTEPFTSHQPETLFQAARFIINSLGTSETSPRGISKASTFYTLSKQSMVLGTYKLARLAFDRLSKLKLSAQKQDEIELDMMIVQAKPVRDNSDHLPVCYRCGSTNPLLNPFTGKYAKSDVCTNCGHTFIRSLINFDLLPLVEFAPISSISDEEAIDLIRQSKSKSSIDNSDESKWKESQEGDANVIRFDGDYENGDVDAIDNKVDLFTKCLNDTLAKQILGHFIATPKPVSFI